MKMRIVREIYDRFYLRYSVTFAVLIFFTFLGAASAQNKVSISVFADTVIERDRVELGKISRMSGRPDSIERLKNISLGYAPNVGMTREVSREQIALAIRAAGFADGDFELKVPVRAVIQRTGQLVPQAQIRAAVEKAVSDRFVSDKVSIQIVRIDLPPKIEVAAGKIEIRTITAGIRNMFERFSMPVEIRIDGKTAHSFAANVEIEAFAEVFVARKDLAANTRVDEPDVKLEKRKLERPITNYFRETDSLRGIRLVKKIASGDPLTSDSCVAAIVIQTGDQVRVEARSGRMKIIVTGEARTSGRIGDRIAVKNTQSGAIMQGIIVDAGLVKVIL
jgi:flagella basal body P-ring formation protein FlgA